MRRPTPRHKLYAWYEQALAGWEPAVHPDEPQCGWYRTKLVKGGVWVPAVIWMEQDADMITGELLNDETLQCTIYGRKKDPYEVWAWLCKEPVTEEWFHNRAAELDWAREHTPDAPDGRPDISVDWLTAPVPSFAKKEPTNE